MVVKDSSGFNSEADSREILNSLEEVFAEDGTVSIKAIGDIANKANIGCDLRRVRSNLRIEVSKLFQTTLCKNIRDITNKSSDSKEFQVVLTLYHILNNQGPNMRNYSLEETFEIYDNTFIYNKQDKEVENNTKTLKGSNVFSSKEDTKERKAPLVELVDKHGRIVPESITYVCNRIGVNLDEQTLYKIIRDEVASEQEALLVSELTAITGDEYNSKQVGTFMVIYSAVWLQHTESLDGENPYTGKFNKCLDDLLNVGRVIGRDDCQKISFAVHNYCLVEALKIFNKTFK